METEDGNAKIARFKSTFNIDEQTAMTYLEAAQWNVELAASNFVQNLEGKIGKDPQTDPSKILSTKCIVFVDV